MMLCVGTRLGPFKVLREIRRGGMGIVYLAHDTRLDREVAIKALPEHLSDDADRLARFQREAKVFARYSEETKWDIWYTTLEGEHEPKQLMVPALTERAPALSPDGNWLVYSLEGDRADHLFLTKFPSAIGKWQVLPGFGLHPKWSKDDLDRCRASL